MQYTKSFISSDIYFDVQARKNFSNLIQSNVYKKFLGLPKIWLKCESLAMCNLIRYKYNMLYPKFIILFQDKENESFFTANLFFFLLSAQFKLYTCSL